MAITVSGSGFADKAEIRRLVAETNERMGFVPDPAATVEKVRAMMAAEGVRPEDNAFTTELMRIRYEAACAIATSAPNPP